MKYEYKNTGIEWLSYIPKHWKVDRIKDYFRDDLGQINEKELARIEEVYHYSIPAFDESQQPDECTGESINSGKKVLKGKALLYSKLNCWKPRVWLYDVSNEVKLAVASTEFIGLRPVHLKKVDLYFIQYLIGSEGFTDSVKIYLKSVTNSHQRISPETFVAQDIPLPPLPEQRAIADYLDKACKRIDSIIDIKQKQLERIEGYFQNRIHEIIRKGIKNEKLDNVYWLWTNSIPSMWKKKRLKDYFRLSRGVDLPKDKMEGEEYPVYGSNGIIGYHNEYTTNGPGITVGRSGSVGAINFVETDYWAHNTCLYVYQNNGNNLRYIYYFLLGVDLSSLSGGSAVGTLNRNYIHKEYVAMPNITEQNEIVRILDILYIKTENLKNKLNTQITTLKTYRKSLIHECVTGKKQVWEGEIEKVN